MIDKAFGLQTAVRNAVYNDETRYLASSIVFGHMTMTEEEITKTMFELLSHLASQTSYETVSVLLSQEDQDELATTIEMLSGMENN